MIESLRDKVPESLHYGFMVDDQLLHLYITWEDCDNKDTTYELCERDHTLDSRGEWLTDDLMILLGIHLAPRQYPGKNSKNPRPASNTPPTPVVVRTWHIDGTIYKAYTPLTIPTPMGEGTHVSANVGVVRKRELCAVTWAALPGKLYYVIDEGWGDVIVYECIAVVGNESILLRLNEDEVVSKLVGAANG